MLNNLPDGYIQPPAPSGGSTPNSSNAGSALPPAGHARDEELSKRTDQLAEQMETQAPGVESVDPNKVKPIPEIQRHFDPVSGELDVSAAQSGFSYLWCYQGEYSRHITRKRAMGWEIVQGNDPESIEHKAVGSYRQVGDCILMRIPSEIYERIRNNERRKATDREQSVGAELIEKGAKYGVNVTVEGLGGDPKMLKSIQDRAAASNVASTLFDQQIRNGQVAGMPAHR